MRHNSFRLLPLSIAVAASLQAQTALAEQTENPEVIQVKGIRSSLTESMDIKKNAASIQDSIVAEDIGKFPDQNVAESLQRLTGVMISRNNGEGAQISVRGMGPKFNAVKVNNRTIATTERGREFDFQSVPSELIAGADVIKAARANIAEGSLGAYVNINTARPLKSPGYNAVGSIQATYNDLADDYGHKISGIVSNTFANDSLGVVVGVSRQETTNRIDAAGTTHWGSFQADNDAWVKAPVLDNQGNTVDSGTIWFPGRATYTLDTEERTRTSANATMQWAATDDLIHTVDFLYTELSRQAKSNGIQVPFQGSGWEDVVVSQNYTVLEGTRYQKPIDILMQERGQDSETFAFGYNAEMYVDQWKFNADLAYSKSEATPTANTLVAHAVNPNYDDSLAIDDPNYIDGQIKGVTAQDYISFDNRGDIMTIDSTIEYDNPNAIRTHWNDIQHSQLEDEVLEAKFDATYEYDGDNIRSIDVGLAYTDREKSKGTYKINHGCFNTDLWQAPTAQNEDEQYIIDNTQYPFNTCGQRFKLDSDLFAVNNTDYLSEESGDFPRNFVLLKDFDAYKQAIGEIRQEPNWTDETLRPAESVANTEETLALYTQVNFEGETSLFRWSGNAGLRYVETETSSTGHRRTRGNINEVYEQNEGVILEIDYTAPEATTVSKSYNHLLPSINFNADFENGLFVKLAAAKVITRPALEDTGVNSTYPARIRADQYNTKSGNPYLDPYEATQYDLAFEYYADNGDSYSASLFYKDISTFISQKTVKKDTGYTIALEDWGTFYEYSEEQTNRSGGKVSGIELAALHYFDYLPGWLDGFGIQANYTYTNSEDKEAQADELSRENVLPGGSGLEGFSKTAYNLIAFYDKDAFQARLAYNWRDDYLKHRSGPVIGSNGLPQHVEAYGQFDFSTSYDISDQLTLSAEVINLTNENILEYADVRERMTLLQYSGRRFQVGLTAKF
ncbi:TonB-dependent receptor [Catenovulum agarivorans DS-2]|uniref:TonB-dependent receptor n=1 Tax=Catenovulum agarivorans DS-2 TaxID=1328313 RepID=W7QCF8_9ALTE|nr:TonB-dependent receptor [Catenovulum agarivorans]EWH09586.1 TonB-dependent receptor [Catenovulum agarivorans DS-2]